MAPPRKSVKDYERESTRLPNGCLVHKAYNIARKVYFERHPKGERSLLVCHTCDNHHCIEDRHHFLGTSRDNIVDSVKKGRHSCFKNMLKAQAKSPFGTKAWKRGLSGRVKKWTVRGTKHGCAKLTDAVVRMIRISKEPARQIGRRVGVSHSAILKIRNNKLWTHVI
jgi:hypothetical protein